MQLCLTRRHNAISHREIEDDYTFCLSLMKKLAMPGVQMAEVWCKESVHQDVGQLNGGEDSYRVSRKFRGTYETVRHGIS